MVFSRRHCPKLLRLLPRQRQLRAPFLVALSSPSACVSRLLFVSTPLSSASTTHQRRPLKIPFAHMALTLSSSTAPDVPAVDAVKASIVQKLALIVDDTWSDHDKQILGIFKTLALAQQPSKDNSSDAQEEVAPVITTAAAMSPATAVSPAAAAAATHIRQLCPDPAMTGDLEAYLMALWETVISVVKVMPYDSPLQDEVVAVLESLRSHAKTTVRLWGKEARLWRDLPLLLSFMSEAWIDPAPEGEDEKLAEDGYSPVVSEWINLNAFAARIMEKGLLRWTVFAVMGISQALEREPPNKEDATRRLFFEAQVQTASQWILLGGTEVFRDAFRTNGINETELQATPSGALYVASGGRPGLNMNRWWFWKKRLEELGSTDDADGINDNGFRKKVRAEAQQAARHMDDIVAHDGRVVVRRLDSDEADTAEGKCEEAPAG